MHASDIVRFLLPFSILVTSAPSSAQVFNAIAEIPDVERTSESFNSIEDLFDILKQENTSNLLPSYTEDSPANFILDVRGLPAFSKYEENSTTLTFKVPSLDISESFTGKSRDASEAEFEEFIKANGNDILKRMLQELVATTAIDPVAGNPNSAMSVMGGTDFGFGTDFNMGPAMAPSDVKGMAAGDEGSTSAWSMGAAAGRYSAGEYDNDLIALPIQYTRYGEDPRYQLRVSMPLSYSDTEGSDSFNASLGVGYRFPVLNDDWSLTPALRVGAVGSVDLGSAAVIYSASLTSNYNWYLDDLKISMGNMLGYYATESLDVDDYEIDYDLQNGMTKNGFSFEGSTGAKLLGSPTSWQAAGTMTLFWGDELYIEEFYDIAVTWGTRLTNVSDSTRTMRFGFTYTFGENDFDGFRLNFGYTF